MLQLVNIFFGIIIVFTIYSLFNKNIEHAPDSNVVRKQIFKSDNKCYMLEPVIYVCPILK